MKFHTAKHCNWIIKIAQLGVAFDLVWHNRLRLDSCDLEILKTIPQDSGLILTANHADETDFKVSIELSRRSPRKFFYMVNSEAFEEYRGIAGWWLQRLGGFSVEKGGADQTARRYAVNIVKERDTALVIFPEGDIYYLNDLVQPFKTGAVHMGLQAVSEAQETPSDWTVYLLPVAIKYRYRKKIESILNKRIRKMERCLFKRIRYLTFQGQLTRIMAKLLKRQELFANIQKHYQKLTSLKERLRETQVAVLSKVESKYPQARIDPKMQLIDRTQKMIFFLREQLNQRKFFSSETRLQLKNDLKKLKVVIQMAGWQPQYTDLDPSEERLAETVMNLEREVFGKKRSHPLGNRYVFVRIGEPVDLGKYVESYKKNPSSISHRIAEELRDKIQSLIEKIPPPAAMKRNSS
jgi:1-acyl-sn-glycerol-3-phosphate acyltransferase